MIRDRITIKQLHQLLAVNYETGQLFWKHRPRELFTSDRIFKSWNTRLADKEAFTTFDKNGYKVGIYGKAHRFIWAMHTGKWAETVDHINGIRDDNRLINLRSATYTDQARNAAMRKDNSSGYCGVSKTENGKWRAHIGAGPKRKHLGRFKCATAAAVARKKAEIGQGFTDRHGMSVEG